LWWFEKESSAMRVFYVRLFSTTRGGVHRRLLLRFHAARNSASSGPKTIAGQILKKYPLPAESPERVHRVYSQAMGQGPLTALNSCACFNRNKSRLSSV
jgi:hypothetical protein